jgi:hypothetical protein
MKKTRGRKSRDTVPLKNQHFQQEAIFGMARYGSPTGLSLSTQEADSMNLLITRFFIFIYCFYLNWVNPFGSVPPA